MKLECLQENLAEGLSVVGRVVPNKSTLPVLSNVLLSTRDGELQLTDAIRDLARQGLPVLGVRLAPGERRLDIGSFESYREAVDVVARSEGGEKER